MHAGKEEAIELEEIMIKKMVEFMKIEGTPPEQFKRFMLDIEKPKAEL